MTEKLPINKSILIWARESAGLSVDQLAQKLKRDRQTILDWESGTSSPSYPVLEKLAYDIYKRPVAMFFFPDLPYEDNIKTTFRTLPGTDIDSLPSEISNLIRKAMVMQLNLEELYEEKTHDLITNEHELVNGVDIADFVRTIRGKIGITIDEQFSWKSTEIALKHWRSALENQGIAVFKDAFRNQTFSGFCLFDDRYPLIYINNSLSFSRQIFTLFHELAHLFMKSSGIDFTVSSYMESKEKKYREYEVICNKFAAEFLVPDEEFNRIPFSIEEDKIEHLASLFSVSREVILRKLLERQLCDVFTYNHYVEKWRDDFRRIERNKESGGGNYYNTLISYLGEKYIHDSFKAYYGNKITEDQLSMHFNTSVKNAIELEKRVMG